MKFKNVKEKMNYIDSLAEDDSESILGKISVLSKLSKDKNMWVRLEVADRLVDFDCIETEDILYEMLSDKNRMVRLEALDSIAIGRQPKSIEKVKTMLVGEGYLIRAYAVSTLFDLFVNCYGANKETFAKYKEAVQQSYKQETNPRVLMDYYKNEVLMGNEEGMQLIKQAYEKAVENKEYTLIWVSLHIFEEIVNKENYEQISQMINNYKEFFLPAQKKHADAFLTENMID